MTDGRDFPQRYSSAAGVFQCWPGWDDKPRRYHEWQPVGYYNVPLIEGGGPSPDGKSYLVGRRADRQYVVRACRNCPEIWHQDITLEPV